MSTAARIKKANKIVARLHTELCNAIALREMFARGAYRKGVSKAIGKSFEAHGTNLIINTLHSMFIVTLMRVHDNDDRSASLPTLVAILSDPAVQNAFLAAAAVPSKRGTDYPDNADETIRAIVDQMRVERGARYSIQTGLWLRSGIRAYRKLEGHEFRAALFKLRNKQLAHSHLGNVVHEAKYGYGDDLLKLTIAVFAKLALAVNGTDYNLGSYSAMWQTYASYAWRHIGRKPLSALERKKRQKRIASARARRHSL